MAEQGFVGCTHEFTGRGKRCRQHAKKNNRADLNRADTHTRCKEQRAPKSSKNANDSKRDPGSQIPNTRQKKECKSERADQRTKVVDGEHTRDNVLPTAIPSQ